MLALLKQDSALEDFLSYISASAPFNFANG